MFLWGDTPLGQHTQPELVQIFSKQVQSFGIGSGFLIVMDRTNRFYSIGANDKGQLGIGNTFEKDGWCEIESLADREIKSISCGPHNVRLGA